MKEVESVLAKACEKYAENSGLRALFVLVPYIGPSLDAYLGTKGATIQYERMEHFVQELSRRLEKIESNPKFIEEELFDLFFDALRKTVRSRQKEKQELFANVVAKHIVGEESIDAAEAALRILADLEIIHFEILREAYNAPICDDPFSGLRVITFKNDQKLSGPVILQDRLSNWPFEIVHYAVAELVAKGLLRDEGIGRFDTRAMEYFTVTDTAHWLKKWLCKQSKKTSAPPSQKWQ